MRTEKLPQYELVRSGFLKEADSRTYLLRHKKSGARIVVMENNDNNKVFSIAFRTTPEDDTGVAHIIEHTVLCGSEKYPVKDPFIELVKGSLNTFLNAMTYSDKTVYPVASTNDKDFNNLMSVYLDAVFRPNILKERMIFEQEGWHYELQEPDGELTINGVVYSEMKGDFSNADEVVERYTRQFLFPDNTYGFESGGDPEAIPDLTYEAYLDFYHRYYHPSNSYIFLYGDADMEERLEFLDREYLNGFDRISPDSDIPLQKPFTEPKSCSISYSAGEDDEEEGYLIWAKVFGDSSDDRLAAAYEVLEYALLTAPGAPLKQALLDAGLGEDVYGGVNDGLRQHFFEVVAKNVSPEKKDEFNRVIETTLRRLAAEGLSERSVMAAINSMEFRLREADYGRLPKGLIFGLACLDSWLYDDDDPFRYVEYEDMLAFLKEKAGTGYFEQLISQLADNRYGLLLAAAPETGLDEKREEVLKAKLEKVKNAMSREERESLCAHTALLKEYQETPSTREELETIPMLDVSDIRRDVLPLTNVPFETEGVAMLAHPVPTSGIIYVDYNFNAECLDEEELPWAGLLRSCLGVMDTENYRYQDLIDEINLHTGGMNADFYYLQEKPEEEPAIRFSARVKSVYGKISEALKLLEEMLCRTKFDDEKRLQEIISEKHLQVQTLLRSAGHTTAIRRSSAQFSRGSRVSELLGGVAYYDFLNDLYEHFDEKKEEISGKLSALCWKLVSRRALLVSVTAEEEGIQKFKSIVPEYMKNLPDHEAQKGGRDLPAQPVNEAFFCPSQVQYVARTGNFAEAGLPYTGSLQVLENILNYEYLWIRLRSVGGAYDCFSGFSRTGDCFMVSYRDPRLKETMEDYEQAVDFLKNFSADSRAMTRFIIGAVSEMDMPRSPAALGARSLSAWLSGITEEQLQRERNEVLSATEEGIKALLPYVEALLVKKRWCVVGGEARINQNAGMFDVIRQL